METWIGSITSRAHPGFGQVPVAGRPPLNLNEAASCGQVAEVGSLRDLAAAVTVLERSAVDDHGVRSWALVTGTHPDGGVVLAAHQVPLHPTTAPQYDVHVRLEVTFASGTESGLPLDGSITALRALQGSVEAAVGGDGIVVAHETHAGVRTLHVYVDDDSTVVTGSPTLSTSGPRARLTSP